jgi:hypothetical protein
MKLLEYEELQRMVDYSFGDHSGVLGRVPNAFMKKANLNNTEFVEFINNTDKENITLFIDNIRLYRRTINFSDWEHKKPIKEHDREWLNNFNDEDLLELCFNFPNKKFIIFTAFEDTPLDEFIEGRIPDNVISINATNAVYMNDKINPMPHGIERKMNHGYNHHEILMEYIKDERLANNLLYVNHREDTGTRGHLRQLLSSWATISPKVDYQNFLEGIKTHKFVLCPSGNGIGSARNWETLYLKRVPIMERHQYKDVVFKGFPVLFVDSFNDLTQKLLEENEHLYQEALNMDMNKLDLDVIFKERTL